MKKKSLNVKKITPDNFDFRKILKDKKIFEIYKKFEKNLNSLNSIKKAGVSVSGGPDSMALSFLLNCYKFVGNKKIKLYFYLVDHGLRKESSNEAKLVKEQLRLKKIDLKILKWKGKKPLSNLQSIARQKRYELIFNQCIKDGIKTVFTGHHQDDLYETFFSRLLRGSGTEGLSSFAEFEKNFLCKDKIIKVVRPLLNIDKINLVYTSNSVFNFYVEDPTNEFEKFQRSRLRKLIVDLKKQGLDFKKLNLSINNLASTNKAMNEIVKKSISTNVIFKQNKFLIGPNFFLFPHEIVFRSLSDLIKKLNKRAYPPRGRKIVNLINQVKNNNFIKATLGGIIIKKIHNSVILEQEKTKKR